MSLFRTLPDGFGGTQNCLCLSDDPPIHLRRINAAQSMASTAELPIGDLADETLAALEADTAVPAELRSACEAELKTRDEEGSVESGNKNALVKNAKKRAARSEADASPAMGMTPHNGGIAASHRGGGKNALLANAEKRARHFAESPC